MEIRPARESERAAIGDLVIAHFGSARIASPDDLHSCDIDELDCLVAVVRHTPHGALHYRIDGRRADVVCLVAVPKRKGTGRALIVAACKLFERSGVSTVCTHVAADNLPGRRFLEACGFSGADGPDTQMRYELRLDPT